MNITVIYGSRGYNDKSAVSKPSCRFKAVSQNTLPNTLRTRFLWVLRARVQKREKNGSL
jgi:hypothetical protein